MTVEDLFFRLVGIVAFWLAALQIAYRPVFKPLGYGHLRPSFGRAAAIVYLAALFGALAAGLTLEIGAESVPGPFGLLLAALAFYAVSAALTYRFVTRPDLKAAFLVTAPGAFLTAALALLLFSVT